MSCKLVTCPRCKAMCIPKDPNNCKVYTCPKCPKHSNTVVVK